MNRIANTVAAANPIYLIAAILLLTGAATFATALILGHTIIALIGVTAAATGIYGMGREAR